MTPTITFSYEEPVVARFNPRECGLEGVDGHQIVKNQLRSMKGL